MIEKRRQPLENPPIPKNREAQFMKNTKKSTDSRLLIATGPETTDVRYATGLVAPDPFGLLIRGSRHYLLVSALEAARAHHTCPTAIIQTPAQLFPDTIPQRQPWEDQVVEWVRQLGCRSVQVGAAFPLGTARALEQGGIRVELVQTPPFHNARSNRRRKFPASPAHNVPPPLPCGLRSTAFAPPRYPAPGC